MPNWCENQIKIYGEPDKMQVIVDKFKELETNNEDVMGFLLGTDDRPADYDKGGWYDYNCEKFGTKWDFKYDNNIQVDIFGNEINIYVMTAWAPPCYFLHSLCAKYSVHARIHYDEPGAGFTGTEEF